MRRLVARLSIPARAAIMSFLLPGLGQFYLGKIPRAVIWLAGMVLVVSIVGREGVDQWVPFVFSRVVGVFSAIDAVIVARLSGPRRDP